MSSPTDRDPPAAPVYRIAVGTRPGFRDPRGEAALGILREAGLGKASAVRYQAVYLVETPGSPADAARAARELLADPVL